MTNTNMQNLLDNDKYFVQNDQISCNQVNNELLETMSSTTFEVF